MTRIESCDESELSSSLLDSVLHEQRTLNAVDQFARSLDQDRTRTQGRYYRDLLPVDPPGPGQQYAFEVDLDACSGCGACVTACHTLNGLEDNELWRNVGQLVGGGTTQLPVLQHVTTACHHCVEPACLEGCPVGAYEKDAVTGVVVHLDDQCIGCQYCTLKCPYDVPVYSHAKGIVRKCDMCQSRLEVGEAPACVQGCPNQAIRIRIVSVDAVREESETRSFLPGAPDPCHTLPTTVFKTERVLPRDTLPADYFSVRKSDGHLSLVVMLVLTQMSVGAFVVEHFLYTFSGLMSPDVASIVRPWHLCTALLLGMIGLGAAILHLGRPLYAYRALLGLRTSWLSREILAFGVFTAAATSYVASSWSERFGYPFSSSWQAGVGTGAAIAGLAAVFCSVMIYVDTRRPLWTLSRTTADFMLTCALLGIPVALLLSLVSVSLANHVSIARMMADYGGMLCRVLIATWVIKATLELSIFVHLWDRRFTPRRRSALLLKGELSMTVLRRYFFGLVGGAVIPSILLGETALVRNGFHPLFSGAAMLLCLVLLTAGEVMSRYLFFVTSVAPRMPGISA